MRLLRKRMVYAVQGPTGEWIGKSRAGGFAWVPNKNRAHFWKSLAVLRKQLVSKEVLASLFDGLPLSACRAVEHRVTFEKTRSARLSELESLAEEFRKEKGEQDADAQV